MTSDNRLEVILAAGEGQRAGMVDIYWNLAGTDKRGYVAEENDTFTRIVDGFLMPLLPFFDKIEGSANIPVHFDLSKLSGEYQAEIRGRINRLSYGNRAVTFIGSDG